ncbi:hypothetical protein PPACK8108_LOCUS22690 [Phakopsora pachyrhizi]|uniref:Uncharacterized protein n=1 Tax=Phakopsora pachyrhizi TaxID=170000 RepID=A0AAV0BMW2_PHAPC|nr:hypothetical protein PPACK8108_LOCUS22690 [Phakopsora pachyrhizi]
MARRCCGRGWLCYLSLNRTGCWIPLGQFRRSCWLRIGSGMRIEIWSFYVKRFILSTITSAISIVHKIPQRVLFPPTAGTPQKHSTGRCQTGKEGSEHLKQRGYYGRNPSLSQPGNSYGDGFHQQQREFGDGPRVISNHCSGGFHLFRARMGPNQNSLGRGGMGLSKNFYRANHLNQQYPQTSYDNNSYSRSFQPTPANWEGHQTYSGYNGSLSRGGYGSYGNGNPYKNINHQLANYSRTTN